ncbi:MAG: hypothetical protein KatS3mg076_1616 [Candidatus Binatia bacterium]|nr:MAG: hypothetical protein KatS3mg076_1616 [Candidatus Binatia bacterium]
MPPALRRRFSSALTFLERHPLLEAPLVFAVAFPAGLWHPVFWILVPLLVWRAQGLDDRKFGVCWAFGSPAFHLVTLGVTLGGYALAHAAVARLWLRLPFEPHLPRDFLLLVPHHFFAVALPEEFLFRGYLQTRLDDAWGRPYTLLGARWGAALPASAAVFALCHLVHGDVTQLKVFFFGLLAGWLREKTGGLLAPVFYHALGNLLLELLLATFPGRG